MPELRASVPGCCVIAVVFECVFLCLSAHCFSLAFSLCPIPTPYAHRHIEVQLILHHWGEDHKSIRAGERAGEEAVGGPLPDVHGRTGLPSVQSACSGQEAPRPVPTLCLRQRDWRLGPGEPE